MAKRNYDRQIMEILKRKPVAADDLGLDLEALNTNFEKFANGAPNWSDSEGEETQVEDEPVKAAPRLKANSGNATAKALISFKDPKVIAFIVGFLILLLLPFPNFSLGGKKEPFVSQDVSGLHARVAAVELRVLALNDVTRALDQQVDLVAAKQDSWIASVTKNFEEVGEKLATVRESCSLGGQHIEQIQKELLTYKKQLDGLSLLNGSPEELQNKFNLVSQKLSQLSKINTDIAAAKSEIIDEFINVLPRHVPVYVKDQKIHYLPEFHKFLHAFVERFQDEGKEANVSWDSFLRENGSSMEKFVESIVKNASVRFLTKDAFEKSLSETLKQNNADLYWKFNSLVDKIDLSGNVTRFDVSHSANKVVLDNLLDVISKGSIKVNYADFKLGSRILGFLTTNAASQGKSLARKLFLGWYDYLSSNGLRAPTNLKYNANNVLIDGGQYWECGSRVCSAGIRLSSPIILTDLVLKNPSGPKPQHISLPQTLSIYVKPTKRQDASVLETYLERFRPAFLTSGRENKYLTKFFKIQEVRFSEPASIEHVRLPVSFVNMKIPVRDIYLEFSSGDWTAVGLYNVKAYGLTEFNSMKYGEEFESILDKLAEDVPEDPYRYEFGHAPVLGDDDYIHGV